MSSSNRLRHTCSMVCGALLLMVALASCNSDKSANPTRQQQPGATCLVIFNSQSGSAVPADTVECGKPVVEPAKPTRDGYAFEGWYTSAEAIATPFDFKTAITSPTMLYARWIPGPFAITFHTDVETDIKSIIVAHNIPPQPPQEELIKKDDATLFDRPFEGWYTDANLQHKFNFANLITADTTLYAKYDQSVYLISTEAQLREVAKYPTSHFRLHNDIELQANWTPIGAAEANFTGRFEGGGHIIKNLKIDASGGNIGLFGVVGRGGVVQAVGLEHVSIKKTFADFTGTGALVGFNAGAVSGYAVGGAVESYGAYVGGLVGNNGGGMVTGYAWVEVTGAGYVGGLVGLNNSGTVTGYALGAAVTLSKTSYTTQVGDLVGTNRSAFIGYVRGSVARAMGIADTSFGLLSFNIGAATAAGYHSGKAGESQLTGFNAGEQHTGYDGNAITISEATQESDFKGLTFGSEPSQWTFKAGHWPYINLKGIPLDRQDEITKPDLSATP